MKNRMLKMVALCSLFMAFGLGAADAPDQVKARMLERLPAIEKLKVAKIVGENNRGYLEFVTVRKEQEELVKAENADRQAVYQAIAAKTNSSVENVGKRRAQQIAEVAKPGTRLQTPAGQWEEKK